MKRMLFGLLGVLLAASVLAQNRPSEGIDYLTLNPPQPTDSPGKVEVIEFFWYRCPHCYSLEPLLEQWIRKLPRDAQFKRVPAVFNDEWALDARVFFALEATGDWARVHRPLYDAIHQKGGAQLKGEAYTRFVADFLAKQGVDPAKYQAAFKSFFVDNNLRRAAQMTLAYRIDGVPALTVNGRYVVSATMSGERRTMLEVTSYLVGEARKQLAK